MDSFFEWALRMFEQPSLTMVGSYGEEIAREKEYDFEHDSLLHKLPSKLKHGGVLIDEGDLLAYWAVFLGACLFFYTLFYVFGCIFRAMNWKYYDEKSHQNKVFF